MPVSNHKITIYLAELSHNGFGLSLRTCPLGIGVIGSYCKKIHGDKVEIRLFRQMQDLIEACGEKKPDIVGFGYFSWNDYLSLITSKKVREICPDALIVFGGSNIGFYVDELTTRVFPKTQIDTASSDATLHTDNYTIRDDLQLLRELDHIDLLIHGDGEFPFSEIVASYLDSHDRFAVKKKGVDGCSALIDGEILRGKPAKLLYDLDEVPSPYVSGLFDEFFEKFQLTPQIETQRGCPFKCTFCTVGLMSSKLRRHSLEYTKEEILYLKKHSPNKVLRIADPNWGIIKHDVELAEYIRQLHDTTGYPGSLRVYYSASGPFKNVKQMALRLKPLLPLNMSFQSMTEEVLKNITRSNMSLDKVKDMVQFAHENRIATSTELISSLPGETYESFRQSFLKAVSLRIDSIYTGYLYLIKGSELYSHESREKYKFKTAFSLIENDVTKVDGRYIFEMDEVVMESTSISRDDFWELHRFRLFCQITYASAFLKEIIMHCMNYQITPLDIYDELFSDKKEYPFLHAVTSDYLEHVKNLYFETPQDLEKTLSEHIEKYGNVDYFTVTNHYFLAICKALGHDNKELLVEEATRAASKIFQDRQKTVSSFSESDFFDGLAALKELTMELIISPLEELQEINLYSSKYDLRAWILNNYDSPLVSYRLPSPKSFALQVRNINEHRDFMKRTEGWSEARKFDFYFKTMVSSNMRRFITYADQEEESAKSAPSASAPMAG